jgi:hypothetical protein
MIIVFYYSLESGRTIVLRVFGVFCTFGGIVV